MQTYSAPKSFTLIGNEMIPFRSGSGGFSADPPVNWDDDWLSFPHLRNIDGVLYSTLNHNSQYLDWRAIVREAAAPQWPLNQPRAKVVMYIRE